MYDQNPVIVAAIRARRFCLFNVNYSDTERQLILHEEGGRLGGCTIVFRGIVRGMCGRLWQSGGFLKRQLFAATFSRAGRAVSYTRELSGKYTT